jgi:hypothetical protein
MSRPPRREREHAVGGERQLDHRCAGRTERGGDGVGDRGAPVATRPRSPAPFAPSGFNLDGACSSVTASTCGNAPAVGLA